MFASASSNGYPARKRQHTATVSRASRQHRGQHTVSTQPRCHVWHARWLLGWPGTPPLAGPAHELPCARRLREQHTKLSCTCGLRKQHSIHACAVTAPQHALPCRESGTYIAGSLCPTDCSTSSSLLLCLRAWVEQKRGSICIILPTSVPFFSSRLLPASVAVDPPRCVHHSLRTLVRTCHSCCVDCYSATAYPRLTFRKGPSKRAYQATSTRS